MSDTIIASKLDAGKLVITKGAETATYDPRFLVAALLIFVARGSGRIEPEESATMLELIQSHFRLESAESLQLLTRAMTEMSDNPEMPDLLGELGRSLSDAEKEDIAVMALKVIAADGRQQAEELEAFSDANTMLGTPPEVVHRAFDRYFAETSPSLVESIDFPSADD